MLMIVLGLIRTFCRAVGNRSQPHEVLKVFKKVAPRARNHGHPPGGMGPNIPRYDHDCVVLRRLHDSDKWI